MDQKEMGELSSEKDLVLKPMLEFYEEDLRGVEIAGTYLDDLQCNLALMEAAGMGPDWPMMRTMLETQIVLQREHDGCVARASAFQNLILRFLRACEEQERKEKDNEPTTTDADAEAEGNVSNDPVTPTHGILKGCDLQK